MTDRAVSTAMGYALVLGIVTLLTTGLVMGFAPLVTGQQADATHSTLEVLGNDLAGDVESVDHLAAAAGSDGTVVLRSRLPERVGGSGYHIEIDEANETDGNQRYEIRLRSTDPETIATVGFRTQIEVDDDATGTLDGGPLEITYDGERLVVREDE
ncbi:DUF7266 family protein [Halobellus ordinarius]|uniref:DUF7266 family protein n=1 Tax=Halobellus ordinarius TaxID=3075120 RepID=UPI0028804ADD|nr:hypothetical protein [Halobellus sp. ZY16]